LKLSNVTLFPIFPILTYRKGLYERTFHTAEYFCYDPDEPQLYGWRLGEQGYIALAANDEGRLWSTQLEAWLGPQTGVYLQQQAVWLRLFDAAGQLLPTEAEAERQRAEAAEAEVARFRQELAQRQGGSGEE
jgi:hypothetical protein